MNSQLHCELHVFEDGASPRRVSELTAELLDLLKEVRRYEVSQALSSSDSTPPTKSVEHLIPGAISLTATGLSIRGLSSLLKAWLERDLHRRLTVKNARTGAQIDISGLPADDISRILQTLAEPTQHSADPDGGPNDGIGDG